MGKRDNHKKELKTLIKDFMKIDDEKIVIEYLIKNSNLPGRRANIEMAQAFADVVKEDFLINENLFWNLCLKLTELASEQAPTNNPKEILSFSGTIALGSIGAISENHYQDSMALLQNLAKDSRWRIREAVCFAIQRIIQKKEMTIFETLDIWVMEKHWLTLRAVAAGLAHPEVLENKQIASKALEIHKNIINIIIKSKDRKSEDFKILRKGLGYTLSVIIVANPNDGFTFLNELVKIKDQDLTWIIKENIKKNRLVKNFSSEVKAIKKRIELK
ncbi:MAG: hypothetical protein ACXAC7_09195 [Candidatus Hodarchaeales archaeon]|jgi:hypothetical protein